MKNSEKDRSPDRALKRATADARCALRKLDLLHELESYAAMDPNDEGWDERDAIAKAIVAGLCLVLLGETEVPA